MLYAIGNIHNKSLGTIYGIQMAGKELQVIWFRKPKFSTLRSYKARASATTNLPNMQIQNQHEIPWGG